MVETNDYDFWVSLNQFGWIVSMMVLGSALSCIPSGIIRSKVGTRMTILIFGAPNLLGWILKTFPANPAMVGSKG
jgi:hypothetical protein